MNVWMFAAGALLVSAAGSALAEDHEAGVPLTPAEAVGVWTLESAGHSICVVHMGAAKAPGGYAFKAPASCGDALPAGLVAWAPAPDGMRLLAAGGEPAIGFNRWSNSLFVSHRSSGVDIQLRRGIPGGP